MTTTFARVETLGASGIGNGIVTASLATGTNGKVFSTNSPLDTDTLLNYFTEPYMGAHELSWPSFRYAYILWIVIGFCCIVWSICHIMLRYKACGAPGAIVRKYGMKRLQIGSTKANSTRRFWVSPSLGFVLVLLISIAVTFCVSYIGPDYLAPTECLWGKLQGIDGVCPAAVSAQPPKTTFSTNNKRDLEERSLHNLIVAADSESSRNLSLQKRQNLNPNGWVPMNDPSLSSINYQIDKNWWVSSSRVGMIAYALLPLNVALALKVWPFAVFAIPYFFDSSYNRLAFFHIWFGRLVWALSTVHVGLWTKQLFIDKDPFGRPVFVPAFQYWRFQAGVVGYVAICAIFVLSINPIRKKYYEIFLYSHVALVIAFLVGCGLHYRYLGPYCFIALAMWGTERGLRTVLWLYINGFFSGLGFKEKGPRSAIGFKRVVNPATEKFEKDWVAADDTSLQFAALQTQSSVVHAGLPQGARMLHSYRPATPTRTLQETARSELDPPPGHAIAQLLPGRTIRLTLRPAKRVTWQTGQHVSLNLPAVRFWQGHPYSIGTASPHVMSTPTGDIPTMTFLLRVRKGFSRALWNHIVKVKSSSTGTDEAQAYGTLMRACISTPLGSRSRGRFENYGTILIVCGGSGVSFGLPVFEHCCTRLADMHRESKITRVRFIWLLKEFSHLTWIAPQVKRILASRLLEQVKIDFYVTNPVPQVPQYVSSQLYDQAGWSTATLSAPNPSFLRDAEKRNSYESDLDEQERTHRLPTSAETEDLVHFDGEEEVMTAAEQNLSRRVQQEGQLRRANSKKNRIRSVFGSKKTAQDHAYPPSPSRSTFGHEHSPSQSTDALNDGRLADRRASAASIPAVPKASELGFYDDVANIQLDVTPQDEQDLSFLAELTRSGRPDLSVILDEEIAGASNGGTLVACCGPATLNTLIRRLVSQRISPLKPTLDLVTEDFDA